MQKIPLKVITGGHDLLTDALLAQALGKLIDPFSRRRAYKCMVDSGLAKMIDEFNRPDNPNDYLLQIARNSLKSIRKDRLS